MDNHQSLARLENLIIDMDGVLWRGAQPMPGLADFFTWLRQRPITFVLATNNATKTPDYYVTRLTSYGIEIGSDEVLTSAQATADYLARRSNPGTPVYVVGMEGLRQALAERGFHLIDTDAEPGSAEYVVAGWDRQLTYDKLAEATLHIRAGARFIGTNPDRTWPSERGLIPGAGPILAALEVATDIEPTIVGKPSPLMFQTALDRLGADASTTAMLGDRLETDILGGHNAGLTTILVLSGVTTSDDLAASPIQPDLVFDDITALVHAWKTSHDN